MPRGISKSIEWGNRHNTIKIEINPDDLVLYYKTNQRGNIVTNKRAFAHKFCTIIEGTHKQIGNYIHISNKYKIWSAEVISIVGMISTVKLSEKDVTVIMHGIKDDK